MRVTTSKSKNSESFYISHSFISADGKSTSKVIKKLGTLLELSERLNTDRDGVMLWAKQQAFIETNKLNQENESVSIALSPTDLIEEDKQNLFNCGYLFIQSILSHLRIDNICRNIKTRHDYSYNLQSILSDLIYARVLSPNSKRSSYAFAKTLLERPKYELHDVYRALSVLASESDYIQAEIYRNSQFLHKRKTQILYYDCTNYYFEIEQEDGIKKYGKSKEHRPNPIVTMGLFMDTDGIPLAFDIFPGNQNEQLTLKPLESKIIRDFGCSDFVYCSDSGLSSKSNRLFNTLGNRAYVITQSLKKLKKENRDIALKSTQYRRLGSDTFIDLNDLDESDTTVFNSIYYKEIPLDSPGLSETLIVTYSPKYKAYQKNIRDGQIERANKIVSGESKTKLGKKSPHDPSRFIKKTVTTKEGEVAKEEHLSLDQSVIDNESMYDGFYGVVTNLEDDVAQVIAINQRRWKIEECFRIMKTDFEARPIYLQREDRIKAHFLTCFLSLLSYRLLEMKLKKKYTVEETIRTMQDMKVCLLEPYGYIPAYTRTKLTNELHQLFKFRTDTKIIKKAKMKEIIKESTSHQTLLQNQTN